MVKKLKKKMVVVFDLDETLYSEESFITQGLSAAAALLAQELSMSQREVFKDLLCLYRQNRFSIFDRFLKEKKCFSAARVLRARAAYRSITPDLCLFPEAKKLLSALKNKASVYVVTDGNVAVQEKKIKALELLSFCKKCIATHRFGKKHAKPSPYCFLKICEYEKVAPSSVVYIADDPTKDFLGIKPLGFHTVRVKKGRFAHAKPDAFHEAECVVESLNSITLPFLEKQLFEKENQ